AMCERLYPRQDHPNLAHSLHILEIMLAQLGQPARALPYAERALAMSERLYPKQDHPRLAGGLHSLGVTLAALGQPAKARPHLERALAMQRNLGEQNYYSEDQALAFVAWLPSTRDWYLSVTRDSLGPDNAYAHIWKSKSAITRVLQDRRAAVRFALTN